MCVSVRAYVRACVRACVCVFGWHENEPLLFDPNNRYFLNFNYSLIGEDQIINPQIMRHLVL